jgi:hypothetical protein
LFHDKELAGVTDINNISVFLAKYLKDVIESVVYSGFRKITDFSVTATDPITGQVKLSASKWLDYGDYINILEPQSINIIDNLGTWGEGQIAHATLPRISIISLKYATRESTSENRYFIDVSVTPTQYQMAVNTRIEDYFNITVIHGTPASYPMAPSVPEGYCKIAEVKVRAASSNILQTDITKSDINSALEVSALKALIDGTITNIGNLTNLSTTAKDNLVNAVNELFSNVSNSKNLIASAITDMGQQASGSDTFANLALKIRDISDDASAVISEVLATKTFYQGGVKRTGTMPNKGAVFITPNTESQAIPEGYHNGSGYVTGDPDLISSNIKSGKNIFGVIGNTNVIDTLDASAVAENILSTKTAFVKGEKITGTMPNRGAISQSLAINGSYTVPAGYHDGTGKITQSVPTKGAQTYTPGTTNQTIAANQYLTGIQTILGDADLIAGNIKSGVNIFGVAGTLAWEPTLAVGDGYILQANTNRSFSNTSYEKKKEIEINYGGQITVYFEYGVVGNNGTCYARVYKNDIAVGTEKSYYISTGTSVTQVWSENFTVNKGDLIQLYAKKSGINTSFVANFKIGISGVGLFGDVNLN